MTVAISLAQLSAEVRIQSPNRHHLPPPRDSDVHPTPRAFPAPAGCSWGPKRLPGPASGLPAGCLPLQRCLLLELCLPALSARALLQRVHPCSGPGQSGSSWGRLVVLGVPRVALGESRNVFGGEDLNVDRF